VGGSVKATPLWKRRSGLRLSLKLPFIAVVSDTTAPAKLEEIEFLGGQVSQVPAASIYERAPALADDLDGHYMDQFTFAEQATDWSGNNKFAESIFQ